MFVQARWAWQGRRHVRITRQVLYPLLCSLLPPIVGRNMLALRRTASHPCRAAAASTRSFHFSPRLRVKVGDAVPDVELMEGTPGTKVSLAKELSSGRGIIVGVPAAYSSNASIQTSRPGLTINRNRPSLLRLAHPGIHRLAETQKCGQSLCCFGQRCFRVGALRNPLLTSATMADPTPVYLQNESMGRHT